ncbi:peptidoglycan-binding domain-containing protein [Streptomyces sp. NBC_00670]|jgi:peptidoglycan hydrolase-like protein with peptidoglycan-binding domain|uniref:peptidoglycan-binding domain-containing protein n=1 Tax=Streptomyces sp. NBC_00670 TaxID=2975804 RepID=UPI002E352323|nr:peptidoglycan-binding domain-containing protein [Streptomyces sp. NBC_00670]
MTAHIRPRLTMALAATLAALTLGGLSAAPASASNSYTGAAYIGGKGVFTDDWEDEGILSTGSNANSNATCLWQKVLWSYGYLGWGDIDGIFGPDTKAATKKFQSDWAVPGPSDGIAGKDTFTVAGYTIQNDGTYNGSEHSFNLWRNSEGHYDFYDSSGVVRSAGYNYRTCS